MAARSEKAVKIMPEESEVRKGLIFYVERYAIHDGPGIRSTIFFKGCPLRCQWCHNPEGQEPRIELMIRPEKCGEECRDCLSVCPRGAISKDGSFVVVDKARCDFCGKCKEVCAYEALEIVGREVTVQEVVDEAEKDRVFFDESGGGVTFSGGEPLMQPDFLEALLGEFKNRGIRTTVDTSGYASFEILERILKNVDLFLYDIKIMDDTKHKRYTGVSNQIILENLRKLAEKGQPVQVRVPLIPGISDDDENIQRIGEYLLSLGNIKHISLLPFHRGGIEKCRKLRRESLIHSLRPPSEERVKEIRKILSDYGFSVKTGR
jgi:pyruvate formate lyase activating enzyme